MSAARSTSRRVATFATAAAVFLATAAVAGAFAIGLLGWERYTGFFAPVWDPDGRHVYFLERETRGFVWGAGWSGFSPPANAYVYADSLTLQRLDSETRRIDSLERFEGSPTQGRTTENYRGYIFNHVSARLIPVDGGVEVLAEMSIPRVPTSEQWALKGTWAPAAPCNAQWTEGYGGNTAAD